jgi:hypothetical protein
VILSTSLTVIQLGSLYIEGPNEAVADDHCSESRANSKGAEGPGASAARRQIKQLCKALREALLQVPDLFEIGVEAGRADYLRASSGDRIGPAGPEILTSSTHNF